HFVQDIGQQNRFRNSSLRGRSFSREQLQCVIPRTKLFIRGNSSSLSFRGRSFSSEETAFSLFTAHSRAARHRGLSLSCPLARNRCGEIFAARWKLRWPRRRRAVRPMSAGRSKARARSPRSEAQ